MGEPHVVTLRATRAGDLDELFRLRHDDRVPTAAFIADDVADRASFEARWRRLRDDPAVRLVTIRGDGVIVGEAARWTDPDDGPTVAFRIDRAHSSHGIASRAMRLFLDTEARPVRVHVADDDAASITVLEQLGFRETAADASLANAPGVKTAERTYVLR